MTKLSTENVSADFEVGDFNNDEIAAYLIALGKTSRETGLSIFPTLIHRTDEEADAIFCQHLIEEGVDEDRIDGVCVLTASLMGQEVEGMDDEDDDEEDDEDDDEDDEGSDDEDDEEESDDDEDDDDEDDSEDDDDEESDDEEE